METVWRRNHEKLQLRHDDPPWPTTLTHTRNPIKGGRECEQLTVVALCTPATYINKNGEKVNKSEMI